MSGVDGFGDVVTGAMVARAVEPQAGEADRDDGHTHERSCLNCGAPLAGPYCAACGQKAHLHRSLRAFGGDMIAGLFNLEGKIWRTLPMLAWWPGDLTRRYIAGERARFVSPLALFLFSVFLLFATISALGGPIDLNATPAADKLEATFANTPYAKQARRDAEWARHRAAKAERAARDAEKAAR